MLCLHVFAIFSHGSADTKKSSLCKVTVGFESWRRSIFCDFLRNAVALFGAWSFLSCWECWAGRAGNSCLATRIFHKSFPDKLSKMVPQHGSFVSNVVLKAKHISVLPELLLNHRTSRSSSFATFLFGSAGQHQTCPRALRPVVQQKLEVLCRFITRDGFWMGCSTQTQM